MDPFTITAHNSQLTIMECILVVQRIGILINQDCKNSMDDYQGKSPHVM